MSTNPPLPDSFDVIVCGTGLPESMIAASLSRIGKKVLHVDRCEYYGGHWTTFTFEALNNWIKKQQEEIKTGDVTNECAVPSRDVCIKNVTVRCYLSEKKIITNSSSDADIPTEKVDLSSVPVKQEPLLNNPSVEKQATALNSSHGNGNSDSNNIQDNYTRENTHAIEEGTTTNDVTKDGGNENRRINVDNGVSNTPDVNGNIGNTRGKPLSMISQARIKQNSDDISLEDFIILSRKFNLDITTKFLFSSGPLVNTIIKANISHYAEFKVVNRVLTWKDDQILEVPCNRSDVFSSTFLTMMEKLILMKFLTFCLELQFENSEEINTFTGMPFREFLESRRLSENLRKFIIYSIALVKPDTPTEVALVATQKFLKSLGRYSKSPFIWPLYGIGELPQAFCRMSAVFGGIYCLNMNIETIELVEDSRIKVCIDGQKIECDHIVMENSYVPYRFEALSSGKMISKGILITNQSLLPTADEHLSFLTIPPLLGHEESVRVIEVGPASSACPSGLFVLYLTCPSSYSTAEEDLLQYTTLLITRNEEESNKPKLLWSLYFNQLEDIKFINIPDNVFIPSIPDSSLGFDLAVEEAKQIFHRICPGEEFMLAVPNSEDIIWGGGYEENVDNIDKGGNNLTNGDNIDKGGKNLTNGDNIDKGSNNLTNGDTIDKDGNNLTNGDNIDKGGNNLTNGDSHLNVENNVDDNVASQKEIHDSNEEESKESITEKS